MKSNFWRKVRSWTAAGCIALGATAGFSYCDELPKQNPADPLAEIKARLERLEKENAELRQLVRTQTTAPLQTPAPAGPGDKGDLEGMIREVLKAEEKRKAAAEEAKKKEEADKGFEVGKDLSMTASWRHGLEVATRDKAFKIHVGGRTQFDMIFMDADPNLVTGPGNIGRVDDAFAWRRARFMIEGQFHEVFSFVCEYDFLNSFNSASAAANGVTANVPVPTDLWIQMSQLPYVGNIRVGNQKPPISFEHLTSSRWLNFMERSYAFDAFIGGLDNGFRPGVAAFNTLADDRIHWSVGVFKNNSTVFGYNVGDGEYDVTGRLTALPVYEDDGRLLVHVGVGASHRDLDNDRVRFRARTLLRNGPAALHTALLDTTLGGASQDLVVPEFVVVAGPWTLQAEYYATWVHDTTSPPTAIPVAASDRGTTFHQSAYVEVLYFLTGEHRRYDKKYPRFDRVIPNENFFLVRDENCQTQWGLGAWQVGVRYSWINLDEKVANSGNAEDITVGLNWFWNPNSKVQFNYSYGRRDLRNSPRDGYVQGFGIRYSFDF
jgi:phosphate-selective porin OprO/OprP